MSYFCFISQSWWILQKYKEKKFNKEKNVTQRQGGLVWLIWHEKHNVQ